MTQGIQKPAARIEPTMSDPTCRGDMPARVCADEQPAIDVRPVQPGDLGALLELCREHAAYEQAAFSDDGQIERWGRALFSDRPSLHGWMAIDGSRPCGFMTVTVDFATWPAAFFAHMDCLFVRESHRGRGLGRVFIRHLRQFCHARDVTLAQWQTPPGNASGIAFYRRIGASDTPKVRFFLDCGRA